MSETRFTPGPWHRNIKPARKYPTVWAGRNTHVAAVVAGAPRGSGNGETMVDEEIEANIDLIAAAPDLYAALETFLSEYVALVESGDAGFWDGEKEPKVIAARSALRRARGES